MMSSREIGITSTIPIEVMYASGTPVIDLNNAFIESDDPAGMVEEAERLGFPESSCAWIKGIYTCVRRRQIERVIAVTQGDCSNTQALMETLEIEGIETIPFMYPYDRDRRFLEFQIRKLSDRFGVDASDVGRAKSQLDRIRRRVQEIDRITWEAGKVSGWENHYFQISCSDMKGDPEAFGREIEAFAAHAAEREPFGFDLRLGYVGIPPIVGGLYEFVEGLGGRVVYNELQRQFSMPHTCADIAEQYLRYTYPYHVRFRIDDIKAEVARRRLHGLIHYVQAFCFRQIEDLIIRKELDIPVLTLEGNRPGRMDMRSRIRVEAFMDMLRSRPRIRH